MERVRREPALFQTSFYGKDIKAMKRITLIILLAALTMSAACGSDAVPKTSDDTSAGETRTEAPDDTEPRYRIPEAVDGGGRAIRFITRTTDSQSRQSDDITADEINGNVLNDNTYTRNEKIKEKYNVTFEIESQFDVSPVVKKSVRAGDDTYDIIIDSLNNGIVYSAEGMVNRLDEFPNTDITAPWWNNRIMGEMAMYDKYYVGINDMTIQAYFSAGIIYFNKQFAEQYCDEDPYELVRGGEWTFDKLISLCRGVSNDLDGDGEMTEKDQYGITYNNFAWQILYYGINEPFIKKDNSGELYFDSGNEKIISYLQKMLPTAQDDSITLYSENYRKLGGDYRVKTCTDAFNENRVMFWADAMYGVMWLREMGGDFGILPTPKYDVTQKEYSSFIHSTHASSLTLPVTIPENQRDLVGRIVEDMAYESSVLVRPAFIETSLKGKYVRDNESAETVDIVINSITTDYTLLLNSYGLSIDSDMRKLLDKGSTDVMSLFAEKTDKWESILEKYSENFR